MTKLEALATAQTILNKTPFSKEDKARAETYLRLAETLSDNTDQLYQARAALAAGKPVPNMEAPVERAFRNYLYGGQKMLSASDRALLDERRDMVSGSGAYPGSGSGYFAPVSFVAAAWSMLKQVDPLFDPSVTTFVESEHGGPLSVPNLDDTSHSASIVSQGSGPDSEANPVLDSLKFPTCPTWRTAIAKASIEVVQDSGIDLGTVLANAFATQFARGVGSYLVSTILTASSLGAAATGSATNTGGGETGTTSVGSDDLLALITSIDPAYVMSPKTGWLMNFTTMTTLQGLKNKQGGLVLPHAYDADGHWLLFSKPVLVSPSMPYIGASAKPILFGDLSRVIVRTVKNGLMVQKLDETFAEYFLTGWKGTLRCAGGLQVTTGSDSPIKYLQNAS